MSNRSWTFAIVVLLVSLCTGLFFTCFERGTETSYRGAGLEARRNPYLAWGRLLEAMGHEVRIIESPADLDGNLPPVAATLFYPAQRLTLGEERSERLLRWVAAGGHLWVVTWTLWDDDDRRADPLLDPLGVHQFMRQVRANLEDLETELEDLEDRLDDRDRDDDDLEAELEDLADRLENLDPEGETESSEPVEAPGEMAIAWPDVEWDEVTVNIVDDDREAEIYFDRVFWLEAPQEDLVFELVGETGAHLVRVAHGSGLVTVVTDDYLLRNDGLGHADHAEVALRVLRRGEGPGVVWMVPAESWPGFWKLLSEHGWAFLFAGGLWLVAWVWRAGRRFGPPIEEDPPVRRSLLEHVEATGRLLGRGRRDVLLEAAREALFDELRARRPGWTRLPPAELEDQLASSSSLQRDEIARALRGEDSGVGRTSFTRAIATLERIRHTL